jgi:hypothetical protein
MALALPGLAFGGLTALALGGQPYYPSDQELLTKEGNVVAAVTILDVQPPVGTRAKPPEVTLRVEALIRGTLKLEELAATWMSPDYHGPMQGMPPTASWLAEPLSAPPPGTRLILLLDREGDEFRVLTRCRYPDTPQVRKRVRKAIADYVVAERKWRREQAREAQAERAKIEARRAAWREAATPELIAQAARQADFVGIGHLVSGPNDGKGTFELTKILRGKRRKPYLEDSYFADVDVPEATEEILTSYLWSKVDVLLFLTENGMDLTRAPSYPLTGLGMVIADEESLRVVRDTLAQPRPRPLPLCVLAMAYEGYVATDAGRAVGSQLARTVLKSGQGICNVASGSGIFGVDTPKFAADKIREAFLGIDRALLVSIDRSGGATLTGIRIGAESETVVFSGESWPPTPRAQRASARRLLARLAAKPLP